MIHATLSSSAGRYYPLNPLFEQALTYIESHWDELCDPTSDGRLELKGDDLYMMVGSFPLKRAEEARLEVHDRYIDIQVILSGAECFGWSQRTACTEPQGEMDTTKDILFYGDRPTSVTTALAGEFVILFPEDAHAPLIRPEGVNGSVRKVIVKVKA